VKFLADENFPGTTVQALCDRQHDVLWVRTLSPGINDETVLTRAIGEDRTLLTFDKDFGELVFRLEVVATMGIVLFRLPVLPPQEMTALVIAAIESRRDWQHCFAVVEQDRIRIRQLPSQLT